MRISGLMSVKRDLTVCTIFVLALGQFLLCAMAKATGRRIAVGEKMPEFSASDVAGKLFDYKHGSGKVLMVVFLFAQQKHSARAAADIEEIVKKLGGHVEHLSVVIAVDDPNSQTYFQSDKKKPLGGVHIVADTEYKLWGKFGIIAAPTVVLSDANDVVLWVKAGHGYDFAPVIHARLNQALGIAQEVDPNDASRVKTVRNVTVAARIKRHLQMAKMLQRKGRLESAISEVRKAKELDPNSVEVALELGELFCKAAQGKAALDVIDGVKTAKRLDRARLLLISGWAKRQMSELDTAEKFLLEATMLNPKSIRGFFELGKVYHAKGLTEKAMETYYKTLVLVFKEPPVKALSH